MVLSFIVPVYNEEKRIEKTARGIAAFQNHWNFSGSA